jgi:EAL domain-containing protein (putative c-di-GMP-specific phosphodiesterase class I)
VVGLEVLARWLHPGSGLIPPNDFIHLIEGTELMHVLTHHMLEHSAHTLLRWRPLGIELPLAVNLSTQDVATLSLSSYLASLLAETEIAPRLIELEVTESSLLLNPTASIEELKRLHQMGFRLYIDDFGTGFSSLSYLTQLPVDVIKIDHSFTMKMVNDSRSAAIVRSTIHMAHDLGMTVVAEGTADLDIWNALDALDCDEAQGFYIARPMPIEDFPQWLKGGGASFHCARFAALI